MKVVMITGELSYNVADETVEKIKALCEADKKKETPKFELITICCIDISVGQFNDMVLIEGNKRMSATKRCAQFPDEAKRTVKALQSAIDFVEANK